MSEAIAFDTHQFVKHLTMQIKSRKGVGSKPRSIAQRHERVSHPLIVPETPSRGSSFILLRCPSRKAGKTDRKLEDTLATHYIAAPTDMGIWDDDYDKFLCERSKLIAAELNTILNPVL